MGHAEDGRENDSGSTFSCALKRLQWEYSKMTEGSKDCWLFFSSAWNLSVASASNPCTTYRNPSDFLAVGDPA